jgi:hypothetical protein
MSLRMLLSSPLAATAAVLAGLALLAIPLRKLTSAAPVQAVKTAAPTATAVPAWLTLKLLAPAESVSLATATGVPLWNLDHTPAGDVETRIPLPLEDGGLDLTLKADFGTQAAETAVFLTITPDGLEEQTRHAIGSGRIEEPLAFSWHAH